MKKVRVCLYLFFMVIPVMASSWIIVGDQGEVVMTGGSATSQSKIGVLCAQENYPGTDQSIPAWLIDQMNQIVQKSIPFRKEQQNYVISVPLWEGELIRLRSKEDCVPKANQHIEFLNRMLDENQHHINDKNYKSFDIEWFVRYIKRFEQISG
jgi:hypothetical protein